MILDTILNLAILLSAVVLIWRLDRLVSGKGKARRLQETLRNLREAVRAPTVHSADPSTDPDISVSTIDEHRLKELEYERDEVEARAKRKRMEEKRKRLLDMNRRR